MEDAGGSLWFVIDVILVAGLALALAYGIMAWRRRRLGPNTEAIRDAATHRAYEENPSNRP
jgi:hypothetical protein